jgi:Lipopolysaccharide-assembly
VYRPVRALRLVLLLVLAAVPSGGCFAGYEIVHYKNALGDLRTIAIRGLKNESFEPGVEAIVSDALVTEFMRRGALELIDDPKAADLVIQGAVAEVKVQSRTFSSIQFALEYAVTVRLRLEVSRRDGTTVDLDDRALQESDLYFASADVETMRKNREEAVRRVSMILAGRVHDSLFERSVP